MQILGRVGCNLSAPPLYPLVVMEISSDGPISELALLNSYINFSAIKMIIEFVLLTAVLFILFYKYVTRQFGKWESLGKRNTHTFTCNNQQDLHR